MNILSFIKNLGIKLVDFFAGREKEVTYLNVPYLEKDTVKKLGAKWDVYNKSWFIPPGIKQEPFGKWIQPIGITQNFSSNTRSLGFFIAESVEACWRCKRNTRVFAFLLPENFQYTDYNEALEDRVWNVSNHKSFLSFATHLNTEALKSMHKISPHYFPDFSKQSSSTYYMNHCEHCNAKLGDFYMHSEPGDAFKPITPERAMSLKLYWQDELFEANVGCTSYDTPHLKLIMSKTENRETTYQIQDVSQSSDKKKIIELLLNIIFNDENLSVPIYVQGMYSEKQSEALGTLYPLQYVWNESTNDEGQLGYSFSINGTVVGSMLEEILPRVSPNFTVIRDEIIQILSKFGNKTISKMIEQFSLPPSHFLKNFEYTKIVHWDVRQKL